MDLMVENVDLARKDIKQIMIFGSERKKIAGFYPSVGKGYF